MALVPSHSLGAFPQQCALLYKTSCPGMWETEADGLQLNPLQAVTYTRLPGMLSPAIPWTVLAREDQTCPWCAREDGSETTELPWDEIVLGQAVLGSSASCTMWMSSHVQIKLWVLSPGSSSVWSCYTFGLAREGSIVPGSLSSASPVTTQ